MQTSWVLLETYYFLLLQITSNLCSIQQNDYVKYWFVFCRLDTLTWVTCWVHVVRFTRSWRLLRWSPITSCVWQGPGWNSMTSGEYQGGTQPLCVSHRIWCVVPWTQVGIMVETNYFMCLKGSRMEFCNLIGGINHLLCLTGSRVEFYDLRCVSEWDQTTSCLTVSWWNPTTSCVSQDPG